MHLKTLITLGMSLIVTYHLNAQTNPDPWKMTVSSVNPSGYYGVTVGNGMIGVVSSPEPFKVKNVVLAGAYDLYGRGRVSNFLNSFNLLNMNLEIDGKRLEGKDVNNFKQELNMQEASFTATFDYQNKATVTYSYCALRQLPYSVLMDVTVKAKTKLIITPASVMEAPDALKDVQNYYNEIDRPHTRISLLTSTAKSPTGKLQLCASTTFLFKENHGNEPTVIHEMWDNNMHLMKFSKQLNGGESYNFSVVGSSVTSAHYDDPLNEAERLTISAKLQGSERLKQFHKQAWNELWKSDILIDGDDQVQQDVHSMLYHLYSFSREGTALSPSPMGLSGLGYNGHVFWDTDVWMFPAMLILHPEIAKSMIEYRFERLETAKKNAFANGYKGAMFPWESADKGVEETPVWALSGPFEHHITACVALAAWNYYCVTQDKDWLLTKGWPILSATADFWSSRVERNGKGKYEIKNVVAADEWAENVDNNAFTNAAAIVNLKNATQAAKILGIKANADWEDVAANIPILKMADGVTKEHATYHGEGIKQADVNLLAYPLKTITDKEQVQKDLKYYQSRVPNEGTPAMTQAIFALLYARLGDGGQAYHFFKDAYQPNLNPPFGVIAETKGGTNPYFATGAGGVIQSLLMGFGGIDITENGLSQVKSQLPDNWKSITITGAGIEKKTFKVSR
ncbi:glycoside hydrolase family 65 protein [Pedobacter sp. HMF7647]|uniref:Glycoside hydrolase family 65 protein n=1 Tax=Hufsiella arboris TaxID=2695275 RepID=A0A7K1YG85_9SPHI|nr:glycoside hydrolase family 65 protein [Hufsiella arboris]MXV53188.1 glycoside hydrolase family 65 protein [Hufsiella arboris]